MNINRDLSIEETLGFNPKYSSFESITSELTSSKLHSIKSNIQEIYFYGAGCSSESRNIIIKKSLQSFFSNAKITIRHDLEAAIKATYRETPIISCKYFVFLPKTSKVKLIFA